MNKNKTVEEFIEKNEQWKKALEILRSIMLSTEMKETIKWGAPVYTINNNNVIGLGAFKSYVGIWFFQGVFLEDKKNILVNAQEGKTKGLRQWRFLSTDDIDTELVLSYVKEAIINEREGKKIKVQKFKKAKIPNELEEKLTSNDILREAFLKLPPYIQNEYAEYIDTAKRQTTKQSRLKKIIPMIQKGIGLNDKYR